MLLTLKKLKKNFKFFKGTKMQKTLKDKNITNKMKETNEATIYNEKYINLMEELNAIMTRKGEHFRARAYKNAEEALIKYTKNHGHITSPDQLKDLSNIGKTILEKLKEFTKTGTLKILEQERNNPFHMFTKIYGVGPKKADDLIKLEILNIKQLREAYANNPKLLNDKQAIGLKYYDAINERIPRKEIQDYEKLFKEIFKKSTPDHSSFEIVGSYRRGAETSGDIDIIITNKNNNHASFNDFLDILIKDKLIIEVLSRGDKKSLTIAQISLKSTPRRIDFLYTPPDEYSFAILYFTGSKMFNTIMRQHAVEMGYTLNEHGLSLMHKKVKGETLDNTGNKKFPDEKAIFEFLNMKYKTPEERVNSDSVEIIPNAEGGSKIQDANSESDSTPTLEENIPGTPTITIKKTNKETKKEIKKKDEKPQNKTLKKEKQIPVLQFADKFKEEGISGLKSMSEDELSKLIRASNSSYYCDNKPLMQDNQYDILIEYTLKKYPNNEAAKEGHTAPTECQQDKEEDKQKKKVKLPYEMWSMDKIKPDTGALAKFTKKYKGPYVLSTKLDGVSGLFSTETKKEGGNNEAKLYTRGDGKYGQDISHLIKYLNLPIDTLNITIRGEFIIKKATFDKKYASTFANPRNFVAGIINHKIANKEKLADIDFVAYEVIKPENLSPSKQFEFLEKITPKNSIITAKNKTTKTITNDALSKTLMDWRGSYEYEIDGIICANDNIYPRTHKNPEYAFAFKMVISDQVAEAKVVDVLWTPSKDGYIKPRIQIEQITLGGVKIEYATGFNAKFIEDNKIGVGALVRIIRSGDVIPYIQDIITPAETALMPNKEKMPYKWNETHVDILLEDKEADQTVKEKNVVAFFKTLGVDGLGPGTISRIMNYQNPNPKYDTIPKILAMNQADFLEIDGFKKTLANKIHDNIQKQVKTAILKELMAASNIFGRGFGEKKLQIILDAEPNIIQELNQPQNHNLTQSQSQTFITRIEKIQGMAKKTAKKFVEAIPEFITFLKEAKLTYKLDEAKKNSQEEASTSKDTGHQLYDKKIVMTGIRDKKLEESLKKIGAEIGSSVSQNTFVLIAKSKTDDTTKANDARKHNIPIMTLDEFKDKYNI